MKITIVAGARPNFMKIAPITRAIEAARGLGKSISYRLVYTGRRDDTSLDASLFSDLDMKAPDVYLGVESRRTSSGVTYTVEEVGDQDQIPTSDRDTVALRWVIRTADGQQITSSYERGDTIRSAVRDLRRGVQESVKLIGAGGRISAWMPSDVAYGVDGDRQLGIAPNATLYYEIELLEVDKYANRFRRR